MLESLEVDQSAEERRHLDVGLLDEDSDERLEAGQTVHFDLASWVGFCVGDGTRRCRRRCGQRLWWSALDDVCSLLSEVDCGTRRQWEG